MSADDYWVIRKHPLGGYAAVHGFSSDKELPKAVDGSLQFSEYDDAYDYAWNMKSRFGVSLDREVWEDQFGSWAPLNDGDIIVDFDEV